MNTKISTLIVATLFSLNLLIAQQNGEIKKFSLNEAVSFALKNNDSLKNTVLDEQIARKKVKEITANGLPQINATSSLNHFIKVPSVEIPNPFQSPTNTAATLSFPQGIPFSWNNTIQASQLLFDGTFFLGLKAAKEFVEMSKIDIKRSEIDVENNITKGYYAALIIDENIQLFENTLKRIEKTYFDINELYKNGLVEKIDADRLRLTLANTQTQFSQLKDQKELVYYSLKMQMGLKVSDKIELTDQLNQLMVANNVTVSNEKASYENRIEYRKLLLAEKLNNLDKKRYQYGYMPSLAAFGNYTYNTFGVEFSNLGNKFFDGTLVGAQLTLPIFDGMRKSAQIQQVKLNAQKLSNTKKMVENLIDLDRTNAQSRYERAKEQLVIQKDNFNLAQDIYNKSSLKLKEGVGSSLELTNADNDLKQAQTNYLTSIYNWLNAQIELKRAVGK
ncbi:MAG: TolC family protein [Bacteroidota bacterium]